MVHTPEKEKNAKVRLVVVTQLKWGPKFGFQSSELPASMGIALTRSKTVHRAQNQKSLVRLAF